MLDYYLLKDCINESRACIEARMSSGLEARENYHSSDKVISKLVACSHMLLG